MRGSHKFLFVAAGIMAIAAMGSPPGPRPAAIADAEQMVRDRLDAYPPAPYEGQALAAGHGVTGRGCVPRPADHGRSCAMKRKGAYQSWYRWGTSRYHSAPR